MNVHQCAYDPAFIEEHGELFPEEIVADPWIAFHGTSGSRADAIEISGLEWPGDVVCRDDVQRVVGIFRAMNWSGLSLGGLPVLEPFSLNHDFRVGATKPIYLAEYSMRALTFATSDFAGGETCRALRYALGDLKSYLDSEEVRVAHARGRGRRWDGPDGEQKGVDIDWLRAECAQLSNVREICERAKTEHQFGVVYAVRFGPSDLGQLVLTEAMGIESRDKIHRSKLVAKVLIPENAAVPFDVHENVRDRYLERLSDSRCLLGKLRHREDNGN
jgi:hypothetical protein